MSHTAISVVDLVARRADAVFVFNAANSPFLPLLRASRLPVATHVDGLEWRRAKWSSRGRRYYRIAESLAVRWSDALVADAQGIEDYYREEFGASTVPISYGTRYPGGAALDRVAELGLEPDAYHLVVARFEPENHVDTIVEGYVRSSCTLPLVVVGSAPYGKRYTERVHELADARVRLVGGVWDNELLDGLYAGCRTYLHGHSVGGTNPSLLRAMGAGAAVVAFDVNFNREVLGDTGVFFRDADDVAEGLELAERDPAATRERGVRALREVKRYDWDDVAKQYEDLARDLADRRRRTGRPSGRRRRAS